MTRGSKVKIILALIGIFAAGCVVGGYASVKWSHDTRAKMTTRDFSDRHMKRMAERLELSEAQIEEIRPLMIEFTDRVRAVRKESFEKVRAIFHEMNDRLEPQLDPVQLERHHEFLSEQQARFDRASRRWEEKDRPRDGRRDQHRGPGGGTAAGE